VIVSGGKSGGASPATWIDDSEKYALIGLSVKVEGRISTGKVAPHLSVLADTKFDIPPHWREWLGTIRVEAVEHCNLLLISKMKSFRPGYWMMRIKRSNSAS